MSMRAAKFAAVNSLLNGRPFSALALADIDDGIPLLPNKDRERALFIVNMPFALEPMAGTLVPTAAGGENGYEKTVSALKAIGDYAKLMLAPGEARAVVLTYSIGNSSENRWVIVEEAKKIFGSANVDWEMLIKEKLWRVNGRKEQPNPMPLSSLKLKADCRYYVRDPRTRDKVRVGFIEKERDLRRKGHDSLTYGILSINKSGLIK